MIAVMWEDFKSLWTKRVFRNPLHTGDDNVILTIRAHSQGKEDEDNCVTLREVIKHLCTRLQDMERRHQEEKERLQVRPSSIGFQFILTSAAHHGLKPSLGREPWNSAALFGWAQASCAEGRNESRRTETKHGRDAEADEFLGDGKRQATGEVGR